MRIIDFIAQAACTMVVMRRAALLLQPLLWVCCLGAQHAEVLIASDLLGWYSICLSLAAACHGMLLAPLRRMLLCGCLQVPATVNTVTSY
jgi:hypothetical protein